MFNSLDVIKKYLMEGCLKLISLVRKIIVLSAGCYLLISCNQQKRGGNSSSHLRTNNIDTSQYQRWKKEHISDLTLYIPSNFTMDFAKQDSTKGFITNGDDSIYFDIGYSVIPSRIRTAERLRRLDTAEGFIYRLYTSTFENNNAWVLAIWNTNKSLAPLLKNDFKTYSFGATNVNIRDTSLILKIYQSVNTK
jgi:hypothetical protein